MNKKRLLVDLRFKTVNEVSWEQVLLTLEIRFKRRKFSKRIITECVAHSEMTPSLFFWERSGRFLCHGCGWGGDMLDFAAFQLGIQETDLERLESFFNPLFGRLPNEKQLSLNFDE